MYCQSSIFGRGVCLALPWSCELSRIQRHLPGDIKWIRTKEKGTQGGKELSTQAQIIYERILRSGCVFFKSPTAVLAYVGPYIARAGGARTLAKVGIFGELVPFLNRGGDVDSAEVGGSLRGYG